MILPSSLSGGRAWLVLMGGTLLLLSLGCQWETLRNVRALRSQNPFLADPPDNVIDAGPVLGMATSTSLTVSLKTDDQAVVTLEIAGRLMVSSEKRYHHFLVTDLVPATPYTYRLLVQEVEDKRRLITTPYQTTRTLPVVPGPFTFCVYGDMRTQPEIWKRIATAVEGERPDFGIALGDFVRTGADKREWLDQFFRPASSLLAQVPQFLVLGDHDLGGERWVHLFPTPGRQLNWVQQMGHAAFVGLNIMEEWGEGSANAVWLDTVLKQCLNVPFVFVAAHAPPYASTAYGRSDKNDNPLIGIVGKMRQDILPILEANKVTAILAGHVHGYERIELPSGLSVITSGGGGAPLHQADPEQQVLSPYTKLYLSKYHFLRFNVAIGTCTMEAVSLDGEVLDTRVWR